MTCIVALDSQLNMHGICDKNIVDENGFIIDIHASKHVDIDLSNVSHLAIMYVDGSPGFISHFTNFNRRISDNCRTIRDLDNYMYNELAQSVFEYNQKYNTSGEIIVAHPHDDTSTDPCYRICKISSDGYIRSVPIGEFAVIGTGKDFAAGLLSIVSKEEPTIEILKTVLQAIHLYYPCVSGIDNCTYTNGELL